MSQIITSRWNYLCCHLWFIWSIRTSVGVDNLTESTLLPQKEQKEVKWYVRLLRHHHHRCYQETSYASHPIPPRPGKISPRDGSLFLPALFASSVKSVSPWSPHTHTHINRHGPRNISHPVSIRICSQNYLRFRHVEFSEQGVDDNVDDTIGDDSSIPIKRNFLPLSTPLFYCSPLTLSRKSNIPNLQNRRERKSMFLRLGRQSRRKNGLLLCRTSPHTTTTPKRSGFQVELTFWGVGSNGWVVWYWLWSQGSTAKSHIRRRKGKTGRFRVYSSTCRGILFLFFKWYVYLCRENSRLWNHCTPHNPLPHLLAREFGRDWFGVGGTWTESTVTY